MPRYFFNIRDGNEVEYDSQGRLLPDEKAAQEEASRLAADLLLDGVGQGPSTAEVIEVVDEKKRTVFRVSFIERDEFPVRAAEG